MSVLYINSQAELESAFETMGFEEGTGTYAGKWYFSDAFESVDSSTPYFTLQYYTDSTVTPIIYTDSLGTANNMMNTMTAATQSMKIEYYKLYGGGVIFRAGRETASSIVSSSYDRMLNFTIFPLNNNTGWNIIFNVGNSTTLTPKLDTLDGAVYAIGHYDFSNSIGTANTINITKLYDNRNGFIDAEVYICAVPLNINTESTLFATINGIEYLLGFGRSNGSQSRYAFRLADPT